MAEVQQSFLKKIYEKLIERHHNDIKLVFQDGSTTGSKICLTALSPYFEAMLTSDMLEKNTGVVTLPTVSKQTFHDVLKFHFIGEDVVNDVNCFLLLDIAEMMQFDALKSLCVCYLNNNLTLTTENCVNRWRLLKRYGMDGLATKALQYVVKNFEELSNNGSVMDLTKDEYIQVLSQDDLSQKEDDVLRDALTWITEKKPSVETMVDLFNQIRFEYVSFSYLSDNIDFTSFLTKYDTLQQIVQKSIESHSFLKGINPFIDNRFLGRTVNAMFVLTCGPVMSVACLTDKTWYRLPPSGNSLSLWFTGAALGKSIYITGGSYRETSTTVYDVWEKTWSSGPCLNYERFEHCMAVLGDTVYVIGGKRNNTIEQLRVGQDKWQVVGDLGCSRRDSCAEAVGTNILVMGGKMDGSETDQVHCFNTRTRAVSTINIKLKSGIVTRSYLVMPKLYLLHCGGSIDVIHIDDSNIPTLRAERVVEIGAIGLRFGFGYKDGSIIVISEKGLEKVDIRDGFKESIIFDNTPHLFIICGAFSMHLPRFCLQENDTII
ncbi:kelch-like protein 6 [Gigantopelta aegis]|uniref:kelch-like protein 6 n=1 Tax=Gigantopelta aegis TaxID=1735272 RepID=UPI001B88D4AD|nr:kelch-like protein 6 [Gigantopelta aegis]